MTPSIHSALQANELVPREHLVDTGYVDAGLRVSSQRDYQVDLIGPARPDLKWQAWAGPGFEAARFAIDWQRKQATCPMGRTSISWTRRSTSAPTRHQNQVLRDRLPGVPQLNAVPEPPASDQVSAPNP